MGGISEDSFTSWKRKSPQPCGFAGLRRLWKDGKSIYCKSEAQEITDLVMQLNDEQRREIKAAIRIGKLIYRPRIAESENKQPKKTG